MHWKPKVPDTPIPTVLFRWVAVVCLALATGVQATTQNMGVGDSETFVLNTEGAIQVYNNTGFGDSAAFTLNTENPSSPLRLQNTGAADSPSFVLNTQNVQAGATGVTSYGDSATFVLNTLPSQTDSQNVRDTVGYGDSPTFVLNTLDSTLSPGISGPTTGFGDSGTFVLNTFNPISETVTDNGTTGFGDSATFELDTLQGAPEPDPVANTTTGYADSGTFILDTLSPDQSGDETTGFADSNTFTLNTQTYTSSTTTVTVDTARTQIDQAGFADSPHFTLNTLSSLGTSEISSTNFGDSNTFTLNTRNISSSSDSGYSDSNTFTLNTGPTLITESSEARSSYGDSDSFTLNTLPYPNTSPRSEGTSNTFTLDTTNDSDQDGLTDASETNIYSTDPANPDTDQDGINDGTEIANSLDPLVANSIPNGEAETAPGIIADTTADSDNDGLRDASETHIYNTSPTNPDSDSDGINDGQEIANNTNPLEFDGETDGEAESPTGIIADTTADSDNDGLRDATEINIYNTSPTNPDSDSDGINDGQEIANNTNPLHFDGETDGDAESPPGIIADTTADSDNDGLRDATEIHIYNTSPTNPDSDSDGINDGQEIANNTNPLEFDGDPDGDAESPPGIIADTTADSDNDGLRDASEINIYNTSPTNPDSDYDGINDGQEIANNTNPLEFDGETDGDAESPPNITADTRDSEQIPDLLVARYLFDSSDIHGDIANLITPEQQALQQGTGTVINGTGPFGLGLRGEQAWWQIDHYTHPDPAGDLTYLTARSFSIAVWVRIPEPLQENSTILTNLSPSGTQSLHMYADHGTGSIIAEFSDANRAPLTLSTNSSVLDGQWHEITLTVSSGEVAQIYLDGQLEDNQSHTGASYEATTFLIGASSSQGENNLQGAIQDLRLFNYALSPEEAQLRLDLTEDTVNENADPGSQFLQLESPSSTIISSLALSPGQGDTGNAAFTLTGNQLVLQESLDYEQIHSLPVRIRATLDNGYFTENVLLIKVSNLFSPIVETMAVEDGDILVGNILETGGLPIISAGFYLSTSPRFTESTTQFYPAEEQSGTTFRTTVTGLTRGRSYYYQAWAENIEGTSQGTLRKFVATGSIQLTGPWATAQLLSDGWYDSSFGIVYLLNNQNWAYHELLGWIYVVGESDQDVWIWIPGYGWHWTGAQYYPYLYRHNLQGWVYLLKNAQGEPVYYNTITGQIE